MGLVWLDEIELWKKSLHRMQLDRDRWKSACIDLIVYEQYGHDKISPARYQEIFSMCHEATALEEKEGFS